MAKVFGVELRNESIIQGKDGWRVEAHIFIDNVFVGYYLDDGNGGDAIIKFECESGIISRFYYTSWRYFASYPDIDSLALYELSKKEFVEYKSCLPKVDYKGWSDEKIALIFIEKIIYLLQIEKLYQSAKAEGYDAIAVVHFYTLKNIKAEQDRVFYYDNSQEQLNEIIQKINDDCPNYILRTYSKQQDFEIE